MADNPFLSYSLKQNFTSANWRLVNDMAKRAIVTYLALFGGAEAGGALYSEQNTKAGLRPKKLDPSRRMPINRKDQVHQEVIRLSSDPGAIGYFCLSRRMASFEFDAVGKPCRFLALSVLKLIEEEFPGSVIWRSCHATDDDWRTASNIVESINGTSSIAIPDVVDSSLTILCPDYMDFRA